MNQTTAQESSSFLIEKLDHQQRKITQQIYSVFQRSYRVEAELLGVALFPPLLSTLQDIRNRNTDFYGYWQGKDLAAVAELDISDTLVDICSFVVDPDFFRMGIGSRLLNTILSYFPDRNKVVETGLDNHPAIALYMKHGFREERRLLNEIGIAKTRLWLSKS